MRAGRGSTAWSQEGPFHGERSDDASWGFAQLLEHIDVGILVLDLHRQAIDYRNPLFFKVLQDDNLSRDFQALYDLLLKEQQKSLKKLMQKLYQHLII